MDRLILLRHAKSAYPEGVPDHDRPLDERGRANAARIAARLSEFIPPDARVAAAVSTAVRAQQTWQIVHKGLSIPSWSDRSLYLAEPDAILEVASAIDSECGIVVGHNPGLEQLALSARGAQDAMDRDTLRRLAGKFPTSAFAVLDQPEGDWLSGNLVCAGFAVCR